MQRPSVGLGPKVTVMVVRLGDSKFPVPYSNRMVSIQSSQQNNSPLPCNFPVNGRQLH